MTTQSPLHWGAGGHNRFDDPARAYGVLYASATRDGAFAETCLRAPGATLLSEAELARRSFARLVATAPLALVALYGPGLARIGATSRLVSGRYEPARPGQPRSTPIRRRPTACSTGRGTTTTPSAWRCSTAPAAASGTRRAWACSTTGSRSGALLDKYGVGL